MTSVEDVASETGQSVGRVLDACRKLGIMASSAASGLSGAEHDRLRQHFGLPDSSTPAARGSQNAEPARPPRRRATPRNGAPPRRVGLQNRSVVRGVVVGCLLIAIGVAVVSLRERGEDSTAGDVDDLTGSCADLPDGIERATLQIVDCAGAHDVVILSVVDLEPTADGDTYPGTGVLRSDHLDACSSIFEDLVGADAQDSAFDPVLVVPTEVGWDRGDRRVYCLLESSAGPIVGPVTLGDS